MKFSFIISGSITN